MSLYNITFNNVWKLVSPPNKRKPKLLAWGNSLMFPMQWLRDLWLGWYKTGATCAAYNNSATYNYGDRVIFKDGRVYVNILNNGLGTVGIDPTDPTVWAILLENFIGADERVNYNAQIIEYEYALNRWFQVSTGSPQIYIQNNTAQGSFVMGNSSSTSSYMPNTSSNSISFLSNAYIATPPSFTIFVPSALFATLGTTTQNRENAIRSFADKYKLAGTDYDVQTF